MYDIRKCKYTHVYIYIYIEISTEIRCPEGLNVSNLVLLENKKQGIQGIYLYTHLYIYIYI